MNSDDTNFSYYKIQVLPIANFMGLWYNGSDVFNFRVGLGMVLVFARIMPTRKAP